MTESRAAFRWLWAGQSTSVFGSAISKLAIPTIAIISLGAAPFAVGALEAAETIAFPLLGLAVGVWIDRWSRRATMLAANAVRAAALTSVALAGAAHVLGYAQLFAVALCAGIAAVFFQTAYQPLVAAIVPAEQLEGANARLEFTNSAAQIAGNGVAGGLIALIGAPLTVIVDAATYVVSIGTLAVIRVRETHRGAGRAQLAFFPALREGLAVVFGSPVLVRILVSVAAFNFGSSMILSVYLIYAYRLLHLSPAVVGLLFAVSNFGFAGALFASRLARRLGPGPTMIGATAAAALAQFAYPLAQYVAPLPVLFLAELGATMFVPIFNITQVSLRHRLVSADKHGRMNATLRTIALGTLPLGTLAGGALGGTIGIVATLVVGAVVSALALPPLLTRPIRELRYSSVMSSAESG